MLEFGWAAGWIAVTVALLLTGWLLNMPMVAAMAVITGPAAVFSPPSFRR